MKIKSPFRYPGGKSRFLKYIIPLLPYKHTLIEPFVGGGAVYLGAQFNHTVINDKDAGMADFWRSVHLSSDEEYDIFEQNILSVNLTAEEFHKFKNNMDGISTFLTNRCGFSGRLHKPSLSSGLRSDENSKKTAAKPDIEKTMKLCRLIREIFKGKIEVYSCDFENVPIAEDSVIYSDPPYVGQGTILYRASFTEQDHHRHARWLIAQPVPWILSYDDHPLVRELYNDCKIREVNVYYSNSAGLTNIRKSELIITPCRLDMLDDSFFFGT